jgi:hypothetical protein
MYCKQIFTNENVCVNLLFWPILKKMVRKLKLGKRPSMDPSKHLQYWFNRVQCFLRRKILPFWCVFYVRQAIKTAVRDLVLHGIVSQSNRPSIINGVRFYDCCSNINCRLSRSKKASNINFTWILTDFPK